MPKVDPALWRDIMNYLRLRHGPICRQWFDDLTPLALDSGLLKIHTSNSVQQNYLQRRCLEPFTEAAQATTGWLVAVRFVHGEEVEAPAAGAATSASASSAAPTLVRSGARTSSAGADRESDYLGLGAATAVSRSSEGAPSYQSSSLPQSDVHFDQMVISPDYSFDNFVTGPNNRLAYAAAVAVANNPGTAYNPLFIHGGVGLGKTHLLQAVCQAILKNKPNSNICYLSCDGFMTQFLDCVQRGQMSQFRHYYRHVDVLVIDDIHFLTNRERTQEEFFHTFNALYQSKRQIVLSSDSPPAEIPQLEERLISRFQWGLVANITKPCYETRLAIVRSKAQIRGLGLPDDVVHYIATRIDSNARELEGAINTIQGFALSESRTIDLPLAQQALGEPAVEVRSSQVTLQQIIDVVTASYHVKLSDLQSKRRHKSITEPRQLCMWLARKRTRFSLQEIGGYFGGRDHTTVMHSIRTIDERVREDTNFGSQVQRLDQAIAPNV